jgi:hypothetical protein
MAAPQKRQSGLRRVIRPAEPKAFLPTLWDAMNKYSDCAYFDLRARATELWLWDARRGEYRRH